ncbi:MAG: 3-hydroxyacyl-ACP dehydratase FabZ family protein [Planctomycetaceae bacterium]
MKFCLVDRITALVRGESIQAYKQVSLAEEYLQDHFPGFAVLPGVLMVECMVQTCAWLSRVTDDFRYSTILLHQARAVRFNGFVKPGETLVIAANYRGGTPQQPEFQVAGTVDGRSAVSARLTLSLQNLADRHPGLRENDDRLTAALRDLLIQVDGTGQFTGRS